MEWKTANSIIPRKLGRGLTVNFTETGEYPKFRATYTFKPQQATLTGKPRIPYRTSDDR